MSEPDDVVQLQLIPYSVDEALIAAKAQTYMTLTVLDVNDKPGLAKCRAALTEMVTMRTSVNRHRLYVNKAARDYIKGNDDIAKRLTAKMAPIEDHLREQVDTIKREKERIAAEEKAKREAVLRERLEQLQAVGGTAFPTDVQMMSDEEFDAVLKEATEAHEAKLAAAEVERKEREAEAERQRAESERLEKERLELEAEKERLRQAREAEEAELQREAEIQAEKQREEQAEIDRQRAELQAEKDRIKAERLSSRSARLTNAMVVMSPDLVESLPDGEFDDAISKAIDDRAEQAERDRIKAKRQAEEAAEQVRIETEARIKREAAEKEAAEKAEAEKQARREARRPWREKIGAIVAIIDGIQVPNAGKGCGQMKADVTLALKTCSDTIREIIQEDD